MESIHQVIRSNYTLLSETIQAELKFLSHLSDLLQAPRYQESIAEVIYSLNDLSDTSVDTSLPASIET